MKIIGIAGKARSGKDTIAARLTQQHHFNRMAFADPLKEAAKCIFGLSDAQLHGDLKETVDEFWAKTPRRIMQLLGTEAVRKNIDDNVWIKATKRRIDDLKRLVPNIAGVVVPDVRFPNEAEAIREWGGEVWLVTRPRLITVEAHSSETALEGYEHFAARLTNDETIVDLYDAVDGVLEDEKIRAACRRPFTSQVLERAWTGEAILRGQGRRKEADAINEVLAHFGANQ